MALFIFTYIYILYRLLNAFSYIITKKKQLKISIKYKKDEYLINNFIITIIIYSD